MIAGRTAKPSLTVPAEFLFAMDTRGVLSARMVKFFLCIIKHQDMKGNRGVEVSLTSTLGKGKQFHVPVALTLGIISQ
jgi:hypothetical protein